jgi:GT2 family glycosyltransferase
VASLSDLSIVIINYNTRDDLRACLSALAPLDPPAEVIVVDNGSTDGSEAMVAAEFPQALLLAPGQNLWFCGGNNLGIAAARAPYVLLLNPDTIPDPGALEALLTFADAHPEYAGVTAQLRYPNGVIQRTCSRVPTYRYLLFNHTPLGLLLRGLGLRENAQHWYYDWDRTTSREVAVVPGSCLLGRRDTLMLDGDLLLYFPEDDLARRLGKPFYFLAEAHIIHREKSSTSNWNATRVYFRDLLIYTRKHHGEARAWLLWLLSRPLYYAIWLRRHVGT